MAEKCVGQNPERHSGVAESEERRAWTPAATGGTRVPPDAKSKSSCHFVDIHTAVKEGLSVNIEELKAAVDDPEGWAQEFGEWNPGKHLYGKIELFTFSAALKVEIFSKLRMAFERRSVRVPISRLVREDLHSINRVTTASGGVTNRAPHSADGHVDRCTALALALRAAHEQPSCGKIYLFPDLDAARVNTSISQ
jgi:hypothetical protein